MIKEDSQIGTAIVPKELWLRARVIASQLNISRSELIRRALEEYLEKLQKKDKI